MTVRVKDHYCDRVRVDKLDKVRRLLFQVPITVALSIKMAADGLLRSGERFTKLYPGLLVLDRLCNNLYFLNVKRISIFNSYTIYSIYITQVD